MRENAAKVAKANLETAQKQYELTKAGAWIYDIQNQQHQYEALTKTYESGKALLAKYTIRAPVDGVILAVNAAAGSFISTQGAYGTYTQGFGPVIVMAQSDPCYQVRCFIDEILIPKLPSPSQMNARMYSEGNRHQHATGIRADAALCNSQNRIVESKDRKSGRKGTASRVSVQAAKGYACLPGAACGCLPGGKTVNSEQQAVEQTE